MIGRVFISYRRSDSRADARSIYQRLQKEFGRARLFMDVDSIAKGENFKVVLDKSLSSTAVMLVLIVKSWLDIRGEAGTRRLDDPDDVVRMEISSALRRDLPIIPVLIDDTPIPAQRELPEVLRPLVDRQALRLTHDNFARDADGLADAIARHVPRLRHYRFWAAVTIAVAILAGATYQFGPAIRQAVQQGSRTDVVVIDKAAFLELLKAHSQQIAATPGEPSDERARLVRLVDAKLNDPDRAFSEFASRTADLLSKLEKLRSLLTSQIITEAKAQSQVGDFRQARAALRDLLGRVKAGQASPDSVAEFGESVARALASVGDLSQSIEVYADVTSVVSTSGRLIRGYAEALLAAGQFQRAVSIVETALDPQKTPTAFASSELAWLNDALGQAYENVGQLSTAQDKFNLAHLLMRTAVGEGRAPSSDLAAILNDVTSVSLRKLDMRTARQSLCESIRLHSASSGPRDRGTLFPRLNLVGLSRQMGLIGSARQQLDEVKADIEAALPSDDPLRGFATIHAALLAIADNAGEAGLRTIMEAQRFFEGLAGKGQGYLQRMARIEQIKQIALFNLAQPAQAYASGEVSRDLYRRAFGRLSLDELMTIFWMARAALADRRTQTAEAHYQIARTGAQALEREPGLLSFQADLLQAELALDAGQRDAGKAALEKLIATLFDTEGKGDAYLALADDAIALLLLSESKPASFEAVTLYRQQRGQRTLVRGGRGPTC